MTLTVELVGGVVETLVVVAIGVVVSEVGEEVVSRARLVHSLGVTGGQVVVFDEFGSVVGGVTLSEENRISGSVQDGVYEVRIPLPTTGFGGKHWVTWRGLGADGGVGEQKMAGEFELPDLSLDDIRSPSLTRFEVSPQQVDLASGPAEVSFRVVANDDEVGFVAEVVVFDSSGRELGRQTAVCPDAGMDCAMTMTLPQAEGLRSSIAQVVLVLRDVAGRETRYGEVFGAAWPDVEASMLWIAGADRSPVDHWRGTWGVDGDFSGDFDGDGWSDLMEFALGTDPLVSASQDLLALGIPKLSMMDDVLGMTGYDRMLRLDFRYGPWFEEVDGRLLSEDWELEVERSDDLENWKSDDVSVWFGAGSATGLTYQPMNVRGQWMRLRVKRR